MMKLTGVLLLFGILTMAYEAEAAAIAGDKEDVPWSKVRGYEECDGFKSQGNKPTSVEEICHESECPKYEVLEPTGCGYGERRIIAAKWASTEFDDMSDSYIGISLFDAYNRLMKYIGGLGGANDQKDKITHTVPMIIEWYMDSNFENKTRATMHFYIPADFHKNTPDPDPESDVYISEWDDYILYHRAFGNDWMDEDLYRPEFENLIIALNNEGVDFDNSIAITGVFFKYGIQRHEVMFLQSSNSKI